MSEIFVNKYKDDNVSVLLVFIVNNLEKTLPRLCTVLSPSTTRSAQPATLPILLLEDT